MKNALLFIACSIAFYGSIWALLVLGSLIGG